MLSPERIQSQNTLHACVNQIETDLRELLLPWLNQKTMTIKGEKTAKFGREFNDFVVLHNLNKPGSDSWFSLFLRFNSLILFVRNTKSALSVEVYLGRCDDSGILTTLMDQSFFRTDFTLDEVQNAFATAQELGERARILLSSVSVFSR